MKQVLATCLVTALGCSAEPVVADGTSQDGSSEPVVADGTSQDGCPEPGSFEFSLECEPGVGSSTNTSTGTIVGLEEDPPGTLAISIDHHTGEHTPGIHEFRVPLPEGGGIDLHVDDEVTVSTHDLTMCIGCSILELAIERDGETILYALDCRNETCNESDFDVGPLQFSTVTGRCEPWRSPSDSDTWCNIREHGGLEVRCSDDPDDLLQELFRGQQTTVDCGQAFHVSAGYLIRVVGGPSEGTSCHDHPEDVRQILVIRDGDGLSG